MRGVVDPNDEFGGRGPQAIDFGRKKSFFARFVVEKEDPD
jgi:hypothetical protein